MRVQLNSDKFACSRPVTVTWFSQLWNKIDIRLMCELITPQLYNQALVGQKCRSSSVFSDKDYKPSAPSPASYVRVLTHLSQRVGNRSRSCGLALSLWNGASYRVNISCTFPPWTELCKKNCYVYVSKELLQTQGTPTNRPSNTS